MSTPSCCGSLSPAGLGCDNLFGVPHTTHSMASAALRRGGIPLFRPQASSRHLQTPFVECICHTSEAVDGLVAISKLRTCPPRSSVVRLPGPTRGPKMPKPSSGSIAIDCPPGNSKDPCLSPSNHKSNADVARSQLNVRTCHRPAMTRGRCAALSILMTADSFCGTKEAESVMEPSIDDAPTGKIEGVSTILAPVFCRAAPLSPQRTCPSFTVNRTESPERHGKAVPRGVPSGPNSSPLQQSKHTMSCILHSAGKDVVLAPRRLLLRSRGSS
mmetsp:Transcript_39825/g.63263  ORF Transcript_39825/g.63263 Transcript_39825/m.63263 type:complete len:272 (+) Transcript_39825:1061-1876(+)